MDTLSGALVPGCIKNVAATTTYYVNGKDVSTQNDTNATIATPFQQGRVSLVMSSFSLNGKEIKDTHSMTSNMYVTDARKFIPPCGIKT